MKKQVSTNQLQLTFDANSQNAFAKQLSNEFLKNAFVKQYFAELELKFWEVIKDFESTYFFIEDVNISFSSKETTFQFYISCIAFGKEHFSIILNLSNEIDFNRFLYLLETKANDILIEKIEKFEAEEKLIEDSDEAVYIAEEDENKDEVSNTENQTSSVKEEKSKTKKTK